MSDVPPDINTRALDVIEWAAKAAVGLGSVKVFLSGIYKPLMEWRKALAAQTIREVLAPELAQLQRIIDEESGCADNLQAAVRGITAVFYDLDRFLAIATDNRSRIDETNVLLDEIFHLDRRQDYKKAAEIEHMIAELAERQKARRRGLLDPDDPPPAP